MMNGSSKCQSFHNEINNFNNMNLCYSNFSPESININYNWRDRQQSKTVKVLNQDTENDVEIDNVDKLDDSKSVPIGSPTYSRLIFEWVPFGGTDGDVVASQSDTCSVNPLMLSCPVHHHRSLPSLLVAYPRMSTPAVPTAYANSWWTLIRTTPLSSDIVQGVLGNCWFLSALALVAERPNLLEQILPTTAEQFDQNKRARVRLFKNGKWHSVWVDNRLPCNQFGQLIFSQAKRNQLFVPLIEKAIAKLYGGYDRLVGGHTSEGMTSLTGYSCEILWLPPNRKELNQCKSETNSNSRRSHGLDVKFQLKLADSVANIRQQIDQYWIKIISYNSAGFLLGASCGRNFCFDWQNNELKELDSEQYRSLGLLKNHAYSVLDVVSLDNLRLVKLRNPWGSLVWNGDWSDRSSTWTKQLREQLVPEGAEEGIFWISFDDLCRYFEQIIVCKIQPNWYNYGFDGKFPNSLNDDAENWNIFELKVNDSGSHSELLATLFQEVKETTASQQRPLLAIFVVIFELLNSNATPVIGPFVGSSICNIQNSVTVECELKRDRRYLMGLFGFNNSSVDSKQNSNNRQNYVLRILSSKPILVNVYRCPNSSVPGDMIIQYVKTCGETFYRPNVISYQLNKDWAGLVSVVENLDTTRWLQVLMKTSLKWSSIKKYPTNNETETLNYSHNNNNDGKKLKSLTVEDKRQQKRTKVVVVKNNNNNAEMKSSKTGDDDDIVNESNDLRYLAASRNNLITEDLIPPGNCQLINIITNRVHVNKHISLTLNFRLLSGSVLMSNEVKIISKQDENQHNNNNNNSNNNQRNHRKLSNLKQLRQQQTNQSSYSSSNNKLECIYHSPSIDHTYGLHGPRII